MHMSNVLQCFCGHVFLVSDVPYFPSLSLGVEELAVKERLLVT